MTLSNKLSVLRILLTPFFAVTFFSNNLYLNYLSVLIFFLASLTDWYDGYIARKYGQVSQWGRFLDPLADKVLVSSALLCFAIQKYVKLWIVAVIIFRDIMITGLRAYALYKRDPMATSPLARLKTFSQMGAVWVILMLFVAEKVFASQGRGSPLLETVGRWHLVDKIMFFVMILTVLTGVTYLVENRRHLKSMAIEFCRVFIPLCL